MIQLTEHFTLDEMIFSEVAQRGGIDNTPGQAERANLRLTASLMEAVRTLLGGKAITVHSGYRCPVLNAIVGGTKTSVHPLGLACDFTCNEYGSPLEIARKIEANRASMPAFDQCILEYGWVHLGLPRPYTSARSQFLTKKSASSPIEAGIVA